MSRNPASKVYVWRRLVSVNLLDAWEERLAFVPPTHRVIDYLKSGKSARIDVYHHKQSDGKKLLKAFGGEVREITQKSWLQCQERSFYRVIKNCLCIASDFDSIPKKSRYLPSLLIPAGLAFGTGEHPTTRMCLYEVVALPKKKSLDLLDVGTGSGVLALAASKLGHQVIAIDHDKRSIQEAKQNAKRNGVDNIKWQHVDGTGYSSTKKLDVIVANIFLEPLLKMTGSFKIWLKKEGTLILSGVLHSQGEELVTALLSKKFSMEKYKRIGKWCCIVARKQ